MAIKVIIAGAKGRMGREAVNMALNEPEFELVAAIDSKLDNVDLGETIGLGKLGILFHQHLEDAIIRYKPDVLIDFTTPHVVKEHILTALKHKVRPVVGTTGLTTEDLEEIAQLCTEQQVGAIIAPNFAIGAILMMKFAQTAAKYMPHVEIIEQHHDQKLDAPSGTAIKTAELIAEVRQEFRQGHPEEKETLDGARGAFYQGFPIHSIRLPGLVAHQEVIFGSVGQTLTIRHDSIDRTSFMPGVNLAVKKVMQLDSLVYGLDKLID